jgi:hypothetical protein
MSKINIILKNFIDLFPLFVEKCILIFRLGSSVWAVTDVRGSPGTMGNATFRPRVSREAVIDSIAGRSPVRPAVHRSSQSWENRMDVIRNRHRLVSVLPFGFILLLLAGVAAGQTKWKDYIKGPGVTYTAGSTVSAKMSAPSAGNAVTAPLSDPEGCGRQMLRLLEWNDHLAGGSPSTAAPPMGALGLRGSFSTTVGGTPRTGDLEVMLNLQGGSRVVLRQDAGLATEDKTMAELPGAGEDAPSPYRWQAQTSEAALKYGDGRPVYSVWIDGDEPHWWLLTLDPGSRRIVRIQARVECEDRQVVSLGTADVGEYEYPAGRWFPTRWQEIRPDGSSTTLVFDRLEAAPVAPTPGKESDHE